MFANINDIYDLSTLLVDSHHGQYVPCVFAQTVDRSKILEGTVREETLAILEAGPEHEWYWEAWEDVLNDLVLVTDNGEHVRLHHDGDLWAYLVPSSIRLQWRRSAVLSAICYYMIKIGEPENLVDYAVSYFNGEHIDSDDVDRFMDETVWDVLYGS